jgi:hypothetical protein
LYTEACIRQGMDPAELLPKPRSLFAAKSLTKEMIDMKYNAFENKRKGILLKMLYKGYVRSNFTFSACRKYFAGSH